MFANGPGDRGSIPSRVIPKTQKMVIDVALINTQHCKGKLEQSSECNSALSYTSAVLYFDVRPEQNAIQGDAPEGSDTFQWQLCEEIAWAKIG